MIPGTQQEQKQSQPVNSECLLSPRDPVSLSSEASPFDKSPAATSRLHPAVGGTADEVPDPAVTGDVPLIPVRMLNEFTYCPRLAYLEWVQGEWAENIETLEGTFGHRNVDRTDHRPIRTGSNNRSADEPAVEADSKSGTTTSELEADIQKSPDDIHARTIHLSAPKEGLVAKLDLMELTGNLATPVDYKRGKAPNLAEGAWEPERVQLCAQGLILRENGFESPAGVIYYVASKRRIEVLFDQALIERTRELVAQFRVSAKSGKMPPPLEDSPKCPRCSLVGICLPDEVNLLKEPTIGFLDDHAASLDQDSVSASAEDEVDAVGDELMDMLFGDGAASSVKRVADDSSTDLPSKTHHSSVSKPRVRQLLPQSTLGLPLYVQTQGAIVGKSGERIVIRLNGEELTSLRLIDVSQVCAFGSVMFTAHAIRELTALRIPICHLSYGGWFHSVTTGMNHKNVELRIAQYRLASDDLMRLRSARQLIGGKIRNCRTLLRRHLREPKHPVLVSLSELYRKVQRCDSIATLLGLEGVAARDYFSSFFSLLPQKPEFDPRGRNRRPPKDPVNAVLSFVYSLLTKDLAATLQSIGFDPLLGFYHTPRYGRPSLALDLMEEFRPLIGDSTTLMVFNNGEVQPNSFVQRAGAVMMTDSGRKAVIAAYERRMEQEVTHPVFGYRVSYRRILEIQSRLLARYILGELDEYPSFTTR